jgi:outer membrane lipoprotein carrier protein
MFRKVDGGHAQVSAAQPSWSYARHVAEFDQSLQKLRMTVEDLGNGRVRMKKSTALARCFALALSLMMCLAHAADGARTRLDAFAQGLNALSGTFAQAQYDADNRPGDTATGDLALNAPRQFRWRYAEPFPQLIVADGDNVWIYDEDLDQVTVRKQSLEEAQSPLTVLTDLSQLDRDYRVREAGERAGMLWLELTPTAKEPAFVRCELGFQGNDLAMLVMHDNLGGRNELRFGAWQRNPTLDPKLYAFTPPPGADVIGEAVEHAEVFPIEN